MPPAGLVNGKAHNEYLQSVICHFSSHSSLRRERPLSLKALNDIGYRCKTIYPTNSILCSFGPKQVANRGMGLNQPQSDSARREFRMQRQQHLGARKIDRRRGWEITNNEDQRFSLSFYAIEHDSEHVVDIEVDESGLHPESEDTGNSLIILMAGEIREAARTRDTPQESDVRVRHASQEQQDRCDSGNENSFQDAEQEDTNQCYRRNRELQTAYPP